MTVPKDIKTSRTGTNIGPKSNFSLNCEEHSFKRIQKGNTAILTRNRTVTSNKTKHQGESSRDSFPEDSRLDRQISLQCSSSLWFYFLIFEALNHAVFSMNNILPFFCLWISPIFNKDNTFSQLTISERKPLFHPLSSRTLSLCLN